MVDQIHWHVGRSFASTHLEDACPCPKAPCGLVPRDQAVPACLHHPVERGKTIRQAHRADACPGPKIMGIPVHSDLMTGLMQLAEGDVRPARTAAETRVENAEDALWEFIHPDADREDYPDFQAAITAYRDAVRHEAAWEIRHETERLRTDEVLEPDRFRPCRVAADQIDPDVHEWEQYG